MGVEKKRHMQSVHSAVVRRASTAWLRWRWCSEAADWLTNSGRISSWGQNAVPTLHRPTSWVQMMCGFCAKDCGTGLAWLDVTAVKDAREKEKLIKMKKRVFVMRINVAFWAHLRFLPGTTQISPAVSLERVGGTAVQGKSWKKEKGKENAPVCWIL